MGPEILIASAIGGAALSGISAIQRNNQIEKQGRNTEDAARLQAQQLADRKRQQQENARLETAALRGRLLASAAERGGGFAGSSYEALDRSILGSASRANRSINTNYDNALQQIRLGTQASLDQLYANQQNPVLAGLNGGLQGAMTGIQFTSGLKGLYPETFGK
jgi:uncharacterized membrane protein YccC